MPAGAVGMWALAYIERLVRRLRDRRSYDSADYAIADPTTAKVNVFYQLGVHRAVRRPEVGRTGGCR
jgi:hypothetical protein